MSKHVETKVSYHQRMRYWGGFFDETLYFDIQKGIDQHRRSSNPSLPDNILFDPVISLQKHDRVPLEGLAGILPGHIHPHFKNPGPEEYQGWSLTTRKGLACFKFLQWIKPYLEYTQPQAEVFEEFLRQKREVRRELEGLRRVPNGYLTPQDRIVVEEGFRQKLLAAKAQITPSALPEPARLAGIFDASGYLGIYGTTRQTRSSTYYSLYEANTGLTSVHEGLLDGLHQRYGGAAPAPQETSPSFVWQLSGMGLMKFLADIEPYLIFKHTKVRLVMDFLKVRRLFKQYPLNNPIVQAQRMRILQSYVDEWQQLKNYLSNSKNLYLNSLDSYHSDAKTTFLKSE